MSTDASTLDKLRKQRSKDWKKLVEAWKTDGLQVDTDLTSFDANRKVVDTKDALVYSQREKEWAHVDAKTGKVIASPLATLISVAVQEQGLPSKLYIAYRGRILLMPPSGTGESAPVFDTCYRAGTASVGTAVHPSV